MQMLLESTLPLPFTVFKLYNCVCRNALTWVVDVNIKQMVWNHSQSTLEKHFNIGLTFPA